MCTVSISHNIAIAICLLENKSVNKKSQVFISLFIKISKINKCSYILTIKGITAFGMQIHGEHTDEDIEQITQNY